jgi:hypothetical protein
MAMMSIYLRRLEFVKAVFWQVIVEVRTLDR